MILYVPFKPLTLDVLLYLCNLVNAAEKLVKQKKWKEPQEEPAVVLASPGKMLWSL